MKGDYDYYIYDLVPLGHALYYLSMAKVYDEWINKVTRLREEMREYEEMVSPLKREKPTEQDEILQELLYIKNRINTSAGILTDKAKTAFFFVAAHFGEHRRQRGRPAARAPRVCIVAEEQLDLPPSLPTCLPPAQVAQRLP